MFLATKTGERTGDAARAELERSLQRMGVDHVDLIQLHNLVEPDEWEVAHGPGGAVEALARARDEGLVRHIGVTGHGLRIAGMHLRSLERFPFDSVLFPYNHSLLAEPDLPRPTSRSCSSVCDRDGVAAADDQVDRPRRRWADDAPGRASAGTSRSTDPAAIGRAVRYVLADDRVFLNTTSDARLLPLHRRRRVRAARPPDRRRARRRRRRRSASPRSSTATTSSASEPADAVLCRSAATSGRHRWRPMPPAGDASTVQLLV